MPASRLVRQVSAPRNLFGRLVAQGGFYTAGLQLGSGAVVLPVICAHQGLTWAAGLLYPAFCIGAILGNSLSPLILQRAGQLRHLLMAAISATAAALVVCNAAVPWTGVGVAAVFLATTGAGGVVTGVSSQRRLHRHDLQHVARGTAGRATAHPRCRGVGAGHRRHIGDCADAGPWQRDGALSRSAVAGRRRSGLLRHRGAVRRPDAVCVRHNRHPNATAGNLLDGLRDRPLPAVVSPVYDDLPAVRSDQPGHHVLQPARRPVQRQSARAGDPFQHWIGRRFDAVATDKPPVRGAWPAAGQRTAQRRCCAAVHGGRVVWAVGSRLGVRHGVPAGYGGRSNGGRRIDIVDQRPRARAVPRHPDLRWVDLGRRRSHRAGSCARRNCPKACHHLAGCRRADTGRNRRGGESARTDTNRGDGGHEPASSDLASLPPGHS
ncbi:integral membrane protein [Mycobacterium tuberculosis]|nr:integral membrane protein [Mycobacterium tuberculosis]